MSYLQGYGIFLALALILAVHLLPSVESLVFYTGKVRVLNERASPLLIHCSSDTDDLGPRTVEGYHHSFEWTARAVAGRGTVYTCDLRSGGEIGRFVLFDQRLHIDDEYCGTRNFECDWKLDAGGLFLRYKKTNEYVLQYRF